jgi:tetratricopeptide (TPR) repeat protein
MRITILALALLVGCAGADSVPSDAPRVAEPRRRPLTRVELPTTSGAIFVRNLEGELADAEEATRDDTASYRELGVARYRMGRLRGDIELIASAVHAFDVAIAHTPADGELYALRGKAQGTLHRFADARADFVRAEELGVRPSASPSMTLVDEARRAAERGDLAAAERAFTASEDAIRDPDPMFLSWLYTQRGALLMDHEPERAVEFLRAAVDRLPSFVLAEEHLAEALHLAGHDDEAIARYEGLVARTDDPELMGALAEILAAHGRVDEADALVERARRRFDLLLARFPEAMAWHAAAFFAGPGRERLRARDLLRENAKLRPTPEALVALARAEWAASY